MLVAASSRPAKDCDPELKALGWEAVREREAGLARSPAPELAAGELVDAAV
jgi:hypothetical protein